MRVPAEDMERLLKEMEQLGREVRASFSEEARLVS